MSEKHTITQAMIKAYDDYTHLTLDRRGFMDRLARLAGSSAAAAAIAPMLAASQASAAIVEPDDARIEASDIEIEGAAGALKGYLVLPKDTDAALPGVMVIHENRGLNAHIRDVARRMALEGFAAFAPDFLSVSGGTPADEDKARAMIGELDGQTTVGDAIAARMFLSGRAGGNGKAGAVGFCWGGGLVNQLAAADSGLDAGVAYYGRQLPAERAADISAPLLLHYAGLDDRINAGIEDYRAALDANGKTYELHVYEGVNHAFNNDTSSARYDKEAADLAWSRTVAFFKTYLA